MPRDLFPKYDPALGKIVGRHFDVNPVADDRSNAITPHFAGRVSDDPALIIEHHPKPPVGQDLVDNTFDREQFFFRHQPIVLVDELS